MIFKVGQKYLNTGGDVITITDTDSVEYDDDVFPLTGTNQEGTFLTFTSEGKYFEDGESSTQDLIKLVSDPDLTMVVGEYPENALDEEFSKGIEESLVEAIDMAKTGGEEYYMSQMDYILFMEEHFCSLATLIRQKNADYTSGAGAFANFNKSVDIGVDPMVGLVLRMQDKMQRIISFINQGELKGESVEDAFIDLQGYSMIALGMMESRK